MFLRTLLFFVVMYFLVKLISRLFLPSSNGNKSRNGASFIFRTFQRMAENQRQQQQQNQNRSSKTGNSSKRFEEIEEAEYEEITEEEKTTSTSSD